MSELVKSYALELATPECSPQSIWYRAHIHLENDITEILPYLNTELKAYDYNHETKILLWINNGINHAFRPYEIAIAPVKNREEAEKLADAIVDMVNEIWKKRSEIEPSFEGKKPLPNALDIYKLLPRSNCRECGFPTCMAFANALRSDSTQLSLCPYLCEEDYIPLIPKE